MADPNDQPILSFISFCGMDVLEDLDRDSTYELITRQYRQMPFSPVRIYRLTSDGYELDQTRYNLFL